MNDGFHEQKHRPQSWDLFHYPPGHFSHGISQLSVVRRHRDAECARCATMTKFLESSMAARPDLYLHPAPAEPPRPPHYKLPEILGAVP